MSSIIEVKVEKWCDEGYSIGYHKEKVCFVRNAIPGELVNATIDKENSKIIFCTAVQIKKASNLRIDSDCKYYPICGGCDFRHINYPDEINVKIDLFKETLKRQLSGYDSKLKIVFHKSPSGNNYRNSITLKKDGTGKFGYYSKNSNSFVQIDSCLLADKYINKKLASGVINDLKVRSADSFSAGHFYKSIKTPNKTLSFRLSSDSFFQVNDLITDQWIGSILSIISQCKPKTVTDLYSGVGVISIAIAGASSIEKITAIESGKGAVKNAKVNAEKNEVSNKIDFICGKAEDISEMFKYSDLYIVNPPREGLNNKVTRKILDIKPGFILYSSCKYQTMIRDLNLLSKDYIPIRIELFDMFPRTSHVESLVLLQHKKGDI